MANPEAPNLYLPSIEKPHFNMFSKKESQRYLSVAERESLQKALYVFSLSVFAASETSGGLVALAGLANKNPDAYGLGMVWLASSPAVALAAYHLALEKIAGGKPQKDRKQLEASRHFLALTKLQPLKP